MSVIVISAHVARTMEATPRIAITSIHQARYRESYCEEIPVMIERCGRVERSTSFIVLPGGMSVSILSRGRWRIVALACEPLPLGGTRTWFVCPACDARRQHLYACGGALVCRVCAGLTYEGQTRHRDPGYEFVVRPRRALRKLEAELAVVRSPARRAKLVARSKEMLALLRVGSERELAALRDLRARVTKATNLGPRSRRLPGDES